MRLALLLVATAGCRQLLGFENPTVAGSDGPPADTADGPITCISEEQTCPATAPICAEGVCVECLGADGVCGGDQPVCGSDLHCRACVSHDECDSEVCLISGACADELQVAYVAAGATGTCSKPSPCARVELGMQTGRAILKVSGAVTDTMLVNVNRPVEIYGGSGASISRANNGQVIEASSDGTIAFHDIAISGAVSGTALRCNGGTLVLDRVRILDNNGLGLDIKATELIVSRSIFFNNSDGGARIENTTFTISNSLFVSNGNASSTIGGLKLKPETGSTFELNTVADNLNDTFNASQRGISCDAPFIAHSNIVTGNSLGANCTFEHSLFDTVVTGTGNLVGDPNFLSIDGPTSASFYRIGAESEALDHGVSTLVIDIDGQPRPAGTAPDMGADERQ